MSDSFSLKGIALLFLLLHHLFYVPNGLFSDLHLWGDRYLINQIGIMGKFCVSLFVFLSGYGLALVTHKAGDKITLRRFYTHRFVKLMLNYWLMWLLFVTIGIYCFDITFTKVYGLHYISRFIVDFLGLASACGFIGYNPTWWFYSCILILYTIFPIIYRICLKRYGRILLILCSFALSLYCPVIFLKPVQWYLLPFVLGILFGNGSIYAITTPSQLSNSIMCKLRFELTKCLSGMLNKRSQFFLLIIVLLSFSFRNFTQFSLTFDTIICILVYLLYINMSLPQWTNQGLQFLGKHSFNIFLFHTFIFYLYFQDFIYLLYNPLLIYLLLLFICVVLSVVIEWGKNRFGFYRMQTALIYKIESI